MIALRYIIGIALRVICIIVGIPGNGLVIIVYLKKRRKTGTDVFILGLAVVDFIVCLSFPLKIYAYVTSQFTSNGLCKFMHFILYWNTYLGVFLTAVITVDRYLAVCRPLKRRMRPKQAAVIIATCAVIAGFFAIAPVSRTGIVRRGPVVSMCSYYQNATNYAKVIARLNDALYYSCLLLIVVLYSLIWRTVRMRVKVRAQDDSGNIQTVSRKAKQTRSSRDTFGPNRAGQGTSSCKSKIGTVPEERGAGGLDVPALFKPSGSATETDLERSGAGGSDVPASLRPSGSATETDCEMIGYGGFNVPTALRPSGSATETDLEWSGAAGLGVPASLRASGSAAETDHEGTNRCQGKLTGEVSDRATQQYDNGSMPTDETPPTMPIQAKNKNDTATTRRSNSKTTTMIFVITVIFFVSWIPSKIWSYYPEVRTSWVHTRPVAYDIFFVSLFLVNLNQVVNPFVYSFFNIQFRKECVTVARQIGQCRFWN